MFSALAYLQYWSVRNRLVMRFKRLKQPKYLFGGIVGLLYFYLYFFRYVFGLRFGRRGFASGISPENQLLYECIGALILFVLVFLAWVIPHQRAALAFTEAEVAFLFPAPITRRGLIHFKLLRSQLAILITTLFLTLVTNRLGGHAFIRAAGWWLVLSTLNLHFLGSSFARTMLLDRGISNALRRWVTLALAAAAVGAVVLWARRTMPAWDWAEAGPAELRRYILQVFNSGPAVWLLWPFRLMVKPYVAQSTGAFLLAAGPVFLVAALHYWWVVRCDVAFEEASLEASRKTAEKLAAMRAGRWRAGQTKMKVRRAPFELKPQGTRIAALLWKNLISAGQAMTMRLWIVVGSVTIALCAAMRNASGFSGVLMVFGMIALMLLIWSIMLGPQMLRQDFRQDLPLMDVLKTFPMPGWQIAMGELLGPAVLLTGLQWFLLVLSFVLFSQMKGPFISLAEQGAIVLGAAILIPLLNVITLQIPNAAVLLFPAWFQTGKEGGAGIEATGQRLIFMLGQLIVLLLALAPPSAVFIGMMVIFRMLSGLSLGIVMGALGAAILLMVEAGFGLMLLGKLFEKFDLSKETAS